MRLCGLVLCKRILLALLLDKVSRGTGRLPWVPFSASPPFCFRSTHPPKQNGGQVRLSSIDHISELEKTYEHTTGLKVLNVSSWHISESFRDVQLKHFCPPQIGNAFDYVYTYSIPVHIRQAILKKLGSVSEASTILISPNNTISIINVINLLKHHGINHVCIVNPSYFSVAHALTSAGISYTYISMNRLQ